jgi:hypothetical protein
VLVSAAWWPQGKMDFQVHGRLRSKGRNRMDLPKACILAGAPEGSARHAPFEDPHTETRRQTRSHGFQHWPNDRHFVPSIPGRPGYLWTRLAAMTTDGADAKSRALISSGWQEESGEFVVRCNRNRKGCELEGLSADPPAPAADHIAGY